MVRGWQTDFNTTVPPHWKMKNPLIEQYLNISISVPCFVELYNFDPQQASG